MDFLHATAPGVTARATAFYHLPSPIVHSVPFFYQGTLFSLSSYTIACLPFHSGSLFHPCTYFNPSHIPHLVVLQQGQPLHGVDTGKSILGHIEIPQVELKVSTGLISPRVLARSPIQSPRVNLLSSYRASTTHVHQSPEYIYTYISAHALSERIHHTHIQNLTSMSSLLYF